MVICAPSPVENAVNNVVVVIVFAEQNRPSRYTIRSQLCGRLTTSHPPGVSQRAHGAALRATVYAVDARGAHAKLALCATGEALAFCQAHPALAKRTALRAHQVVQCRFRAGPRDVSAAQFSPPGAAWRGPVFAAGADRPKATCVGRPTSHSIHSLCTVSATGCVRVRVAPCRGEHGMGWTMHLQRCRFRSAAAPWSQQRYRIRFAAVPGLRQPRRRVRSAADTQHLPTTVPRFAADTWPLPNNGARAPPTKVPWPVRSGYLASVNKGTASSPVRCGAGPRCRIRSVAVPCPRQPRCRIRSTADPWSLSTKVPRQFWSAAVPGLCQQRSLVFDNKGTSQAIAGQGAASDCRGTRSLPAEIREPQQRKKPVERRSRTRPRRSTLTRLLTAVPVSEPAPPVGHTPLLSPSSQTPVPSEDNGLENAKTRIAPSPTTFCEGHLWAGLFHGLSQSRGRRRNPMSAVSSFASHSAENRNPQKSTDSRSTHPPSLRGRGCRRGRCWLWPARVVSQVIITHPTHSRRPCVCVASCRGRHPRKGVKCCDPGQT